MSTRTTYISKLIGLFLLVVAVAAIAGKASFVETSSLLVHDRPLLLIVGMILLTAGLALVLTHNVWSGGVTPVLLTVVGWLILIRGIVLLFLTPDAVTKLFAMVRFADFFYLYCGIALALGLYLTYAGFRPRPGDDLR